jgi:predicted RNase H-like HicB family nuclease
MRYMIAIEKGEKSYGAYVPDSPGCVAVAETKSEVRRLIEEAIELHIVRIARRRFADSRAFFDKRIR